MRMRMRGRRIQLPLPALHDVPLGPRHLPPLSVQLGALGDAVAQAACREGVGLGEIRLEMLKL